MATAAPHPYDRPPPWWRERSARLAAGAVFVLTAALTVAMFPAFSAQTASQAAYVFAAPALFWAYTGPSFRRYAGTVLGAQALAWTVLLCWLRHVNWVALLLLGPFVGAWVGLWYLAAWWVMPRMIGRSTPVRLAAQAGLAGLWVLIEWTRTWVLGGFCWLPLAASQWRERALLQVAAYTGAYGISFILVMANVGVAAFFHRLFREEHSGLRRRSQEFVLALFLLLACVCVMFQESWGYQRYERPLGRVAFVQPYIPQEAKWDPAKGPGIVRVLRREAELAGASRPDLILWPESVTPWAVKGDPVMKSFVEDLAARARAAMLMGSDAVEKGPGGSEVWRNAAFVISPDAGVQPAYYAKRHLVPFGEFVPLRPLLGWLSKVVPVGGDDEPGTSPAPLLVGLRGGAQAFGVLICYEDIFPAAARETTAAGADALAVLTNDAWYGEEGAAYQHAAHSVLRAVENRRPVLRCGNGGWSGWIDEYGTVRDVLTDEGGGVYFQGTATFPVERDVRWAGRLSFFARHGDWFVLACAAAAALAHALLRLGGGARPARG